MYKQRTFDALAVDSAKYNALIAADAQDISPCTSVRSTLSYLVPVLLNITLRADKYKRLVQLADLVRNRGLLSPYILLMVH